MNTITPAILLTALFGSCDERVDITLPDHFEPPAGTHVVKPEAIAMMRYGPMSLCDDAAYSDAHPMGFRAVVVDPPGQAVQTAVSFDRMFELAAIDILEWVDDPSAFIMLCPIADTNGGRGLVQWWTDGSGRFGVDYYLEPWNEAPILPAVSTYNTYAVQLPGTVTSVEGRYLGEYEGDGR